MNSYIANYVVVAIVYIKFETSKFVHYNIMFFIRSVLGFGGSIVYRILLISVHFSYNDIYNNYGY